MLNWVDFSVIAIMAAVVVIQVKRGFGKAVFDLAALFVTVRVAPLMVDTLSATIKLAMDPAVNKATVYAIAFVVLGTLLLILGKLIYSTTLVSTEVFEPLLGGICGIATGIILCHALVHMVTLSLGAHAADGAVAQSVMGTEFLTFDTYHRVLYTLYHFNRVD